MCKKLVFTFVLFNLKLLAGNAQISAGMQLGATYNYLYTNISNLPSTIIIKNIGYTFGIPFLYKITSSISIKAIPAITKKNYSVSRTDSLTGIFTQHNNTYLHLAISGQFEYGKKLQVFGNIGCYAAYWLTGNLKGKVPDIFSATTNSITQQNEIFQLIAFSQKYTFNKQRDNRLEIGWIAGGGLQYHFTGPYIVFLDCSYYQSLTDQQKSFMINQISQYNQTLIFSTGVLYTFKKLQYAHR